MQVRNLLLYQVSDKKVNVSVYFEKGTFWLSQKAMAALFGVNRTVVTKHLRNIFETDELAEDSVCANFAHTAEDGKNYETKFYRRLFKNLCKPQLGFSNEQRAEVVVFK